MHRRERERRARAEYILDTARDLIFACGFEETSMDDIAKQAGYTRRTLYAYFKSRDEIGLLVFLGGLSERWARQKTAMKSQTRGIDQVRAWGEALAAFSSAYPQYLRIQTYWDYKGIDESRIRPDVFDRFRRTNEEVIGGLRRAFALGITDGSIRADLNPDMAISQYAYTLRAILNRALFPGYTFARFPVEEYFGTYRDLFLQAISAAQPVFRGKEGGKAT